MKIELDKLPTYLKKSIVFKKLCGIKYIDIEEGNCTTFTTEPEKWSFEDFTSLLRTLYFWKVNLIDYPIEFYIYIHLHCRRKKMKPNETKEFLKKYDNIVAKHLLTFDFNNNFLIDALTRAPLYFDDCNNKEENLILFKYIIDNEINKPEEIFRKSCINGNLNIVNYILTKEMIALWSLNAFITKGLNISVENGHIELVKLFTKKVKEIYKEGYTDEMNKNLLIATIGNHINVAKFLIENGADIEHNNGGPLRIAVYENKIEIVSLLLSMGANIQLDSSESLRIADVLGYNDIVELLVLNGADVEVLKDIL